MRPIEYALLKQTVIEMLGFLVRIREQELIVILYVPMIVAKRFDSTI
jgi:hypothetical protein